MLDLRQAPVTGFLEKWFGIRIVPLLDYVIMIIEETEKDYSHDRRLELHCWDHYSPVRPPGSVMKG